MEFNLNNHVVRLCLQGMGMEENDNPEDAGRLFLQAWNEAADDQEKFIAAHYLARVQKNIPDRLEWLETSLQFALKINNDGVKSAFPSLYRNIAQCHEALNNVEKAEENYASATLFNDTPSDKGPFYHGTRADLLIGDLLTTGGTSNYKSGLKMNHIYFTALINGAGLAAALAKGEGPERVYIVKPTGAFENDECYG